jgi:hypothetical protein
VVVRKESTGCEPPPGPKYAEASTILFYLVVVAVTGIIGVVARGKGGARVCLSATRDHSLGQNYRSHGVPGDLLRSEKLFS